MRAATMQNGVTPAAHVPAGQPAAPAGAPATGDGAATQGAGGERRTRTALDLTRVVVTAEIVVGAVVVADRLARRPCGPKARVLMGPGGWVSMKGGEIGVRPASRPWARPRRVPSMAAPAQRAPLWARVLSAVPLQTLAR